MIAGMHKHLAPALTALVPLLLPVFLYFGAYYALVDVSPYRMVLGGRATCYPVYRMQNVETLFGPAHFVDRELLRPSHWVQPLVGPSGWI